MTEDKLKLFAVLAAYNEWAVEYGTTCRGYPCLESQKPDHSAARTRMGAISKRAIELFPEEWGSVVSMKLLDRNALEDSSGFITWIHRKGHDSLRAYAAWVASWLDQGGDYRNIPEPLKGFDETTGADDA